jgi:hypothetical protein
MADRERRREARRKRKERGVHRKAELEARRAQMAARTEEKNRIAREALEPLEPEERPGVVTVGAIISAIVSVIFLVSAGIAVFGNVEVDGEEPNLVYLLATMGLTAAMAWGMWRARYWAVLGFQACLAIIIVAAAIGLTVATTIPQAIATTFLLGGGGALFYFMVKAMARIQMPERAPREP